MKKSFLILVAGIMAATANGQQAAPNSLFSRPTTRLDLTPHGKINVSDLHKSIADGSTSRNTLTSTGRWYDYTTGFHNNYAPFQMYLDSLNITSLTGDVLGIEGFAIWQDTASKLGYSNGSGGSVYDFNPWTSIGTIFDPHASIWNRVDSFPGDIAITRTNTFTIDSIQIPGWYNRSYANAYKIGVVDTLIITLIQGNPEAGFNINLPLFYFSDGSGYGVTGRLDIVDLGHDSVDNRGGIWDSTANSATPVAFTGTAGGPVYKIPLKSTDTNNFNFNYGTTFPRPGHTDPMISYTVTAGNMVGATISFKSGDTSYHATAAGDTVRYINSAGTVITGYKYGNFEPLVAFNSTDGTNQNPVIPPYMAYSAGDWTDGLFKREGASDNNWSGLYIPTWAWNPPTDLQFPVMNFHAQCPACAITGTASLGVKNIAAANTVNAYPNPAKGQLNIAYTLVNSSVVNVTLSNMMGQVVATQKLANATSGNAIFSTSTLADGIYIYTLDADGVHSTGRVVVAH